MFSRFMHGGRCSHFPSLLPIPTAPGAGSQVNGGAGSGGTDSTGCKSSPPYGPRAPPVRALRVAPAIGSRGERRAAAFDPRPNATMALLRRLAWMSDDRVGASRRGAPELFRSQRMAALAQANDIRSQRAQLKSDLKAGRRSIDKVLSTRLRVPPECNHLRPAARDATVRSREGQQIPTRTRISPSRTIGSLTERQRAGFRSPCSCSERARCARQLARRSSGRGTR